MNTLEREKTITLMFPVELADRILTEVTMRRPTIMDEINFTPEKALNKKQESQQELKYFSHLCGLSVEELKLDIEDYERLQEVYISFRKRKDATKGTDETHSLPE